MATSIYGMIYDELDAMATHNPAEFKRYANAFDMLDREAIGNIILDGNTYWLEWWNYYSGDEEAGAAELAEYLSRKGWRSLYD